MRLRRWVVYEFDALEPPNDLVRSKGTFFRKQAAEKHREWLGPTLMEFAKIPPQLHPDIPRYYRVQKLPKRRWFWRIRRWLDYRRWVRDKPDYWN